MGRKDQIRLVIADDHRRFREGLVELLRREEAIEVVGEAANGREVLKALEEFHPDVLLLDLFMPEMDGLDVLPQIREHNSSTKVLILTGYFDQELVFRSLWEGARGYLQKNVSSAELLKAIRAVHAGEAWIETGVARFVAEGLSNKEVADRLLISEKTVKSHLVSIFRKLHLRHRLQLALYTLERDSILNRRPNDG